MPLFIILKENKKLAFRSAANLVALRMNLSKEETDKGTDKSNTFLTRVSFASTRLKKEGIMVSVEIGIWELSLKGDALSIDEFCKLFNIKNQGIKRKTGDEHFTIKDETLAIQLKDFWIWNQSDILNNALRGILAEYIVATAINADTEFRIEWDAYDLVTKDKIKVEVKSASYLQSWEQEKFSTISFDIAPTKSWNMQLHEYDSEIKRQADVYVFCLLKHLDKVTVNPLALDQWEFYILSTKTLNEKKGAQKTISLRPLLNLNPIKSDYNGINEAIHKVLEE